MDTRPGDILLIHHKGTPVSYARVEEILADAKAGWWQVQLLFLQVPPQTVTWILRDEYVDGGEFTMGGESMRLERLAPPSGLAPQPPDGPGGDGPPDSEDEAPQDKAGGGKVVSLAEMRRRNR